MDSKARTKYISKTAAHTWSCQNVYLSEFDCICMGFTFVNTHLLSYHNNRTTLSRYYYTATLLPAVLSVLFELHLNWKL